MTLVRNLLGDFMLVLIGVALSVGFHYFGSFAVPASILLGVCFTIVALWLNGLWKLAAFEPCKITVYVNFDALRYDLGMSKPDKPPDADEPMYDVYEYTAISAALFAHYRRYTGISATEFNLADRFARSDEEYCSVLAFGDDVPCVLKPVQFDNSENRDPHPKFLFRPGSDGYQFSVRVVPEWWEAHRKQLSTQLQDRPQDVHMYNNSDASKQLGAKVRNRPVNNNDEIALALLPYGYIPDHVRRWDKPMSLFYAFDIKQRRWKAKLAKHGWSMDDDSPEYLKHRYLSITFSNV